LQDYPVKILLYGLNFSPDLTGIGKYSGEMAAWLAAKGHDLRVVTAPPYYPEWRVADGYSGAAYKVEEGRGLTIYRCPLWVPKRPSGAKRLLHLASFALSGFPVMARLAFWRPDVVLVVAPAFFCAPGAWLIARLCGAPCWLHIQDFEVDAAFDLGLLKGKALRYIVTAKERWMLRRFDVVSTISQRMVERLLAKGVSPERAVLFPNWADLEAIAPRQGQERGYRAELGLPEGAVVALYSGNMGAKQGLELLAQAARRCPQVSFVFCGGGAGRPDLVAQCAGLANVRFLDLQPVERLGELLTMADIHLLPQRADAADLVMPSKLAGILASGRPVVATAHPGTEVAHVAAGCGLVVPPEDPAAFAGAVADLAADPERRRVLGLAARAYAEKRLSRDMVLGAFERQLVRLVNARAQGISNQG
jgi:colanic acid biosynthesis glycosyl transferase WcaI